LSSKPEAKAISETNNLLEDDNGGPIGTSNSINFDNPGDIANLMAKHLGKIFASTHRKSLAKIIDNIKDTCK